MQSSPRSKSVLAAVICLLTGIGAAVLAHSYNTITPFFVSVGAVLILCVATRRNPFAGMFWHGIAASITIYILLYA